MPNAGDELHHFGWNACSAALCPSAPHPHVERRYLLVPGLRSSRIHVVDTKPIPAAPTLVKVIEPEELNHKTGYSRPHTIALRPRRDLHLRARRRERRRAGGIFLLDCETFDRAGVGGRARPAALHLRLLVAPRLRHPGLERVGHAGHVRDGVVPEKLLGQEYGHQLHIWDLAPRAPRRVDLGDEHQMVLELRPAHDPRRTYGFVGVVVSVEDLCASVWRCRTAPTASRDQKVIAIPAEPAEPTSCRRR